MNLQMLAEYLNLGLAWIGFGTVVGLAASAILPDRQPGSPVANLLMAIAGTLAGCAVLQFFSSGPAVHPVSVGGFMTGTAGALAALVFYHVVFGTPTAPRAGLLLRSRSNSRRGRRYRSILDEQPESN